ncbi:D-aspartate oxidase isoform X2 [Diabrotica virgifera virgifera]|uniref:D-aspartate oxidase isoform X2 n=2 Tax=Diabrotica virgifera virgifera TaxID=50390 RepID=A0A6P7GC29_DIAVI|nr:D-aspartate oxidase isoform X2 [Diabrotica virgifera virgifera]
MELNGVRIQCAVLKQNLAIFYDKKSISMSKKLAIVGAGAIGLTTALAIQRKFPNIDITIFTKEVSPHTTSDVAAGLWGPVYLRDTPDDKIAYWSQETYEQLLTWWKQGKARKYGVCLMPSVMLTDKSDFKLPKWLDSTLGYYILPKDELAKISNRIDVKLTAGVSFISFSWEGGLFLRTLQKQFTENGGKIVIQAVKKLQELKDFDVIINCAGLGAGEIVGDQEMIPIRGQVRKVEAPWIYESCVLDVKPKVAYIIPNTHQLTLGGTANYDVHDTTISETDKINIVRDCNQLDRSLKSAKTLRDVVGLRPGRSQVRVDIETVPHGDKELTVIHNYGHGGAGITLSLGCAEEASNLLQKILTKSKL